MAGLQRLLTWGNRVNTDRVRGTPPEVPEADPPGEITEVKRDVQMALTPELEARFIEQEHRIVRVVQNYFDRKRWPPDDPRRVAARNAVIWRVLTPGTAAVAAGGLVAIATLVVLVWQTRLIAEQNEFFRDQNQKLQVQIDRKRSTNYTVARAAVMW
jgi:hypothetical protein